MFPATGTSDIIGFAGQMFSNFKGIILLLLGVFIALWILDLLLEKFLDFTSSPIRKYRVELGELVRLGKSFGYKLNARQIAGEYEMAQKEKRFKSLARKFGVSIKKD